MKKLYQITSCRGLEGNCSNALVLVEELTKNIEKIFEKNRFSHRLKSKLKDSIKQHHLFKVRIAACPNACSKPQIKDLGIISKTRINFNSKQCVYCERCIGKCKEEAIDLKEGEIISNNCIQCGNCTMVCPTNALTKKRIGYNLLVGGKLGRHPKLAENIMEDILSEEEILKIVDFIINWYLNEIDSVVKLATLLEGQGIDDLKSNIEGFIIKK